MEDLLPFGILHLSLFTTECKQPSVTVTPSFINILLGPSQALYPHVNCHRYNKCGVFISTVIIPATGHNWYYVYSTQTTRYY